MILDLRDFLQQRRRASLQDLALRFAMDADTLRPMLHKWINKGKIRKASVSGECGGSCCKCDPALTEIYEWLDNT